MRVETGLLNPETDQYKGLGQARPSIAGVAASLHCRERADLALARPGNPTLMPGRAPS